MQTSLAKKIFAIGSTSAMLLAAVPFVASAAAHAAGTNVSSNGTVYFINTSGQKQPYTSAGAFLSYGFNTWADVVPASAEDLALPTGSFVPPSDGSLINDKGTVYLMVNGMPSGFTTEANFLGLGYSYKNVLAGDVSFLAKGSNISTTAMSHPVGTLVNDKGTVYLMTASGKMGIPSLSTFNSWGYSFAKVVPANSYDSAIAMSSGIMNARVAGQLNPTGSTVNIPPVSGTLSVAAASDMPVTRSVVSTEGQADLAHFTFYGTGAVTAVQLKRLGVSADTSLNNVYLFDGATRITDAASVSSGSVINFSAINGLFTVNGSKTISVRADMNASAGETVGIQFVSAMSGSASVSGAPVSGNLMNIATATLATVAMTSATGSGNTDPGTGITVWQGTATVGTRDVLMTRLALRQLGSIVSTDIKNFTLFVDGTQVSTAAALDANGYVTFPMSQAIKTGSRTLKVTADVIGGSGRTVQMSLRGAYDIAAIDTQYNAGITATGTFPFGPASFTVNAGTMTVVKAADSQSQNVTQGASDQSLAKYTLTAYGESIKVQTLNIGMLTNDVSGTIGADGVKIRNTRILVNGSQVGSTTNVQAQTSFAAASGTQFTTNFVVVPGSPATVEIRGDIYDAMGTNDIDGISITSVQALLVGGAATSNGTPQVSLGTINVPSQANVLANTLTIASGSLSLAKTTSYANQTIVPPQTAYKIGSFVLTGNATEAVNLNTIYVGFDGTESGAPATDLTDLYVKYGTTTTTVKGTVSSTILNGNSWSINQTLAINQTMTVDVYATIASSLATNNIKATLAVAGTTAQSGIAVYADGTANTALDAGLTGQTIAGGTGAIAVALDASTPNSAIVDDVGTLTTGAWKFSATSDSYTVTDVTLTLADASAVSTVTLADSNGTPIASLPAGTTVAFHGLNIAVPANASTVIQSQLTMAAVGVGGGTSGASILTTLTTSTAKNSSGSNSTPTGGSQAANVMYVYRALPTITNLVLPSTVLTGGGAQQTLAKFTISSGGTGSISWQKLRFKVTDTANVSSITTPQLWNSDTNTPISGGAVALNLGSGSATNGIIDFVANTEQIINGAKTYELKAVVNGSVVAGDAVNTSIPQTATFATSKQPFAYNAGTGANLYVADLDATAAISANDVRVSAQSSYTAADVLLGVTTTGGTFSQKLQQSYGVTGAVTLTMAEGATDNTVGAATFTVGGAGASDLVCTPYTGTSGTGAVVVGTTLFSAVQSIVCTGTNKQLKLFSIVVTVDSDVAAGGTFGTVTITKGTDYAVGSIVVSTDSDFGLTLTAGVVGTSNFVWSDQSAASHSNTTTDWTSDTLVKNLPTVTQTLIR